MLVLTRKQGERLVIGNNVTISVLSVHGGRIRIGIEAPDSVKIRREELRPLDARVRVRRSPMAGSEATV